MNALVVTAGHTLELRDVPQPKIGPYEALVRIRACGICSTTDREIIKGTQPFHSTYPCLLGHEAVGEVVEVGGKVASFHAGDLVTRPAAIWPGQSRDGLASGWGGFAEWGLVRDRHALARDGDANALNNYTAVRQNVVPTGLDVPAAVLGISLAETASWLRHIPSVVGRHVCVAGTGIAGLSLALWCKLAGACSVTVLGRRPERLKAALDVAADHALACGDDVAAAVKDITGGGADFFLEAVGSKDLLRTGLALLRPGGTVAIYGVTPDLKFDLEWSWLPPDVRVMTPPAEEHLAYAWVADLLRRGIVPQSKLLTHRWPLADYSKAFAAVAAGDVIKGILEMTS
jgi:threonine dehydrogenase-like Zn-dependent dehydrogenase